MYVLVFVYTCLCVCVCHVLCVRTHRGEGAAPYASALQQTCGVLCTKTNTMCLSPPYRSFPAYKQKHILRVKHISYAQAMRNGRKCPHFPSHPPPLPHFPSHPPPLPHAPHMLPLGANPNKCFGIFVHAPAYFDIIFFLFLLLCIP